MRRTWGGDRRLRALVFAAYGTRCWLCGEDGADSIDHVIPLSRGGPWFDLDNLRPAHMSCNQSRGNATRHYAPRRHAAVVPDRQSRSW